MENDELVSRIQKNVRNYIMLLNFEKESKERKRQILYMKLVILFIITLSLAIIFIIRYKIVI